MGLLKGIFGSKREPEWLDVGEVGEDFNSGIMNRTHTLLREKNRRGSIGCIICEYKPGGWGSSLEELQSWVLQALPSMNAQMSQEQRQAISKGDVYYLIGHISGSSPVAGCRCVAVVSLL